MKECLSKYNVDTECRKRLDNFIKEEEYDTEALAMDIDIDCQNSNIAQKVNNQECVQQIHKFIKIATSVFCLYLLMMFVLYKNECINHNNL